MYIAFPTHVNGSPLSLQTWPWPLLPCTDPPSAHRGCLVGYGVGCPAASSPPHAAEHTASFPLFLTTSTVEPSHLTLLGVLLQDTSQRWYCPTWVWMILTLADTGGISYLPALDRAQDIWRLQCPDPGWGVRGGAWSREGQPFQETESETRERCGYVLEAPWSEGPVPVAASAEIRARRPSLSDSAGVTVLSPTTPSPLDLSFTLGQGLAGGKSVPTGINSYMAPICQVMLVPTSLGPDRALTLFT